MLRSRLTLLTLLLLAAVLPQPPAQAQPTVADEDGFTRPLERLTFNPSLDQREFERSTLLALAIPDPLEPWNRRVYHFNLRFDECVLLPVVNTYQAVTPRVVRTGVSNFFNNLADVGSLANSLLQLKGMRSMETTARVLFNSTFGLLGFWDVASHMGLPRHRE
ncbi:MAG TPA: VacJ family lipoprotein, partial [Pseudomonas sp.]|nr:VacJ family lipoprotein [Pseudomonas sp.]